MRQGLVYYENDDWSTMPPGARRLWATLELLIEKWRPYGSDVVSLTILSGAHGRVVIRTPQGRIYESGWGLDCTRTKMRHEDHVLPLYQLEKGVTPVENMTTAIPNDKVVQSKTFSMPRNGRGDAPLMLAMLDRISDSILLNEILTIHPLFTEELLVVQVVYHTY